MHPSLAEHLVRDHQAALVRDAEREALARVARAGQAVRSGRPALEHDGRFQLTPHVRQHGGLRRIVSWLIRPSAA